MTTLAAKDGSLNNSTSMPQMLTAISVYQNCLQIMGMCLSCLSDSISAARPMSGETR